MDAYEKIDYQIKEMNKSLADTIDQQSEAVRDFLKGLRHLQLAFEYGDYLQKSEGWQEGYSFIFDEIARGSLIIKSRRD